MKSSMFVGDQCSWISLPTNLRPRKLVTILLNVLHGNAKKQLLTNQQYTNSAPPPTSNCDSTVHCQLFSNITSTHLNGSSC